MDEKEFKTRADRLDRVAKVIEKLPTEVRSGAFDLLKGYVTQEPPGSPIRKPATKDKSEDLGNSEEEFFAAFTHDKPADNVKLIAAHFYREYGAEAFSVDDIRQMADHVGITIPARIDMTLLAAKDKGKKLFARAGKGKFKPTVHGEANLKTTYSVKKGIKKRVENAE